jgi:copper resistance protein B
MFDTLPSAAASARIEDAPIAIPGSIADVRDPRGPVTAEELATGNIEVEGEPVHDNPFIVMGMMDRLEWRSGEGQDAYLFDGFAFAGGDYNRLWIELEGEGKFDGSLEAAELQVLYSRAITSYWNLQLGVRHDFKPEPELSYAVLALTGLNFYWSGIEADLYVSEDGDVSSTMEIEYGELLTQRLILQPRFEVNLQAQDVPELGLGSGVTSFETGLRLRYEIAREFAPYIGVSWSQTVGETEDLLPPEEDAEVFSVVAGLRFWF